MTWGCNFYRYMHSKGEDTSWVTWDRETSGFVSRFGEIRGIRGVHPSRQLELLPVRGPPLDRPVGRRGRGCARPLRQLRTRREVRTDVRPDAQRDLPAGLRAGRGGPRAAEPLAVRDLLLREDGRSSSREASTTSTRASTCSTRAASARVTRTPASGRPGSSRARRPSGISVAALYALTDITEEGQAHNSLQDRRADDSVLRGAVRQGVQRGRAPLQRHADGRPQARREGRVRRLRDAQRLHDRRRLRSELRRQGVRRRGVVRRLDGRLEGVGRRPGARARSRPRDGRQARVREAVRYRSTAGSAARWETDRLDLNDAGFLHSNDEISTQRLGQLRARVDR